MFSLNPSPHLRSDMDRFPGICVYTTEELESMSAPPHLSKFEPPAPDPPDSFFGPLHLCDFSDERRRLQMPPSASMQVRQNLVTQLLTEIVR
jgi:hypothetical protein